MRYSKYFILPVALACFYGCVDEDFADHSGSQHNVEITARMDGEVSTRTCVGNSTDDGAVGILWTPGDCVGVYGTDGTRNALFASTNTGNVPEAIFSGDLKQGEAPAEPPVSPPEPVVPVPIVQP